MFASHVTGSLARLASLLLLGCTLFFAMPRDAQAICDVEANQGGPGLGWCDTRAEAMQKAEEARDAYHAQCASQPAGSGRCSYQSLCDLAITDHRPMKVLDGWYMGQHYSGVYCPQYGTPGAGGSPLNLGGRFYLVPTGALDGAFRKRGCPNDRCNKEGDGMDAGTGNNNQSATDVGGGGSSRGLTFTRSYNSDPSYMGERTGLRWNHNFDRRLELSWTGAGVVYGTRPDGSTISFNKVGSAWAHALIDGDQLVETTAVVNGQTVTTGWLLTAAKTGSVEAYSAGGQLLTITERDGYQLTMAYTNGLLSKVTDSYNRSLSLAYDTENFLKTVTAPDGGVVTYTRDFNGNLTGVTYPDGTTRTYGYTHDQLSSITENGAATPYLSFTYDSSMRVVSSSRAGSQNTHTIAFDTATGSSVTTTPLGATRTRQHTVKRGEVVVTSLAMACSGCTTRTFARNPDANGNIDTIVDATGVITDTDYTADGLLTQRKRAVGTSIEQLETRQWDTNLQVPTQIDRPGQRQVFTYNSRGQVLTAKKIDTTTLVERKTTYTYCEDASVCGRVGVRLSIDGPRTDVSDITTYAYRLADDAACASAPTTCAYRKGDLWKVTRATGQVVETAAYNAAGRPIKIIDANGVVTDLEYWPRGWLKRRLVRGSDNTTEADDAVTSIDYDSVGNVTKITRPDGSYSSFTYDSAYRLTDIADRLGNSVHYTLDPAGNRIQEDRKNSAGATKHTLARAYDALNQLRSELDGANGLTEYTYDLNGANDHVTDPLSHVADRDVDALGRLTQAIANINGSGAERTVSGYAYDARNNLSQVIDPKGLSTTYTFNGFDEVTQQSSPDTGSSSFTYNASGQRIGQTDARGISSAFSYDSIGRVTAQTFSNSAQNVYFDYDVPQSDCAAGEQFGSGRIARIRDASGSTRYCYDRFGSVVRKVQTVTGGSTLMVGATYNSARKLLAMTLPSGAIVTYTRNAAGQVTRVDAKPTAASAQVTLVSSVSYLPYGPVQAITYGNGRVMSKAFDLNYGIDSLNDGVPADGLYENYTLDAAGNVTSVIEGTNTARQFEYDGVNRLKAQKNGAATVEGFTYDAAGNRLSKTVSGTTTTYVYASGSHRLTNAGSQLRQYDANGNTTWIGAQFQMTYDERNRLANVIQNGVTTRTHLYNGKGERVAKWYPGAPANNLQFVYDERGHLIGEYNSAGYRVAEYVWMDDTLVGVLKSHDGTTYQFVETDVLGTPRAIINPATNVTIWRWKLTDTAFGEHSADGNPDGNAAIYTFNLRYPGQYFDGLANINYNYLRDYDATVGRYVESDPIGLEGGINTYAYVTDNPLGFSDRLGLLSNPAKGAPTPNTCRKAGESCGQRAERGELECAAKRGPGLAFTCKEEWVAWFVSCEESGAPVCNGEEETCPPGSRKTPFEKFVDLLMGP